ncbi:hypothetical protein FZC84_06305 [Rossellomorea vietnamensis]|uniref:Uncharacterized protein n=1 Tax=Rossellomorea vietnamensis TaxID=218284 RepID=A0A5D4MF84_9BACI|nr:hypothetical protein FZC84_06305 [Rossellomorea vietnamensis]
MAFKLLNKRNCGEMMQTFLIFISFTLNIAAFLAIALLYTRQNRLLEIEKRQEKAVKEMEDVISSYLLEMKEDNDRFIQQFQAVKEKKDDRSKAKVEKIKTAADISLKEESRPSEIDPENTTVDNHSYKRMSAVRAYKQESVPGSEPPVDKDIPQKEIETSSNENSFYGRIKRLQEKGYTLEEIARELGKGVTEIELALKFRQK